MCKKTLEELELTLPKFKYLENPIKSGIFKIDKKVVCDCCEQEVEVYIESGLYAIASVEYLCPNCISSGKAAKKYDGTFQSDLFNDEQVVDESFVDEILHRTPGYVSWQGNDWFAHCTDYCKFIGYVGWAELVERGIDSEIENFTEMTLEDLKLYLTNDGDLQGYLFQCLECGKYCLYADCA
ncbi:CbrC family protein [Solibacillus sp. FSL K6-1523]|uniref:CbrC family protein n=1 Tax=Solibacillus sp. FSL K6-1523 TaxID=2921471 RepID=UPI0030FBF01D